MKRTKQNFFEIEVADSAEKSLTSSCSGRSRSRQRAFTINELLIVLAVVGIVAVLPALARPRVSGSRINCANNLKNVGLAFRIFATDNNDLFPMQVSTNDGGAKECLEEQGKAYRVFQSLSNELGTPKLLRCRLDSWSPATDFSTFGNSNISYFIGTDADGSVPASILSGDRNLRANVPRSERSVLTLRTNHFLWWTKERHAAQVKKRAFFGQVEYALANQTESVGNIVLADGSVRLVNNQSLLEAHRQTGLATNRFILPD